MSRDAVYALNPVVCCTAATANAFPIETASSARFPFAEPFKHDFSFSLFFFVLCSAGLSRRANVNSRVGERCRASSLTLY